jgi:hypothetical protein
LFAKSAHWQPDFGRKGQKFAVYVQYYHKHYQPTKPFIPYVGGHNLAFWNKTGEIRRVSRPVFYGIYKTSIYNMCIIWIFGGIPALFATIPQIVDPQIAIKICDIAKISRCMLFILTREKGQAAAMLWPKTPAAAGVLPIWVAGHKKRGRSPSSAAAPQEAGL